MAETNEAESATSKKQTRKRVEAPKSAAVTYEMIEERAYQISLGPDAGDEMDNWLRAERELLGRV